MRGDTVFLLLLVSFLLSAAPLLTAEDPARSPVRKIPASGNDLTVDGSLEDRIWRYAAGIQLEPAENGVPAELNGTIKVISRGGRLCLSAFLPEPAGRVLARSIGYNPVWEQDAVTSPLVEDILIIKLATGSGENDLSELKIEINPLGACRLERNGSPVPASEILSAAAITDSGWSVECAIPYGELYQGDRSGEIELAVTRFRSRRPLDPAFRWISSPGNRPTRLKLNDHTGAEKIDPPKPAPPAMGNTGPALRVGRVQAVPSLAIDPDDPFWNRINAFHLMRNEPNPRQPRFPTEIKWVHDGKRLAILFACSEDARVDCDNGTRDSNIAGDDHVCIYLATTGSSFIEIQINPVGTVRDAKGQGPHMFRTSSGAWTGEVETNYLINNDAWYLRVNLPLDQIAGELGETAVPEQWRVLLGRTRRSRIGENEEISTNPVIGNPYLLAPARFRGLVLSGQNPVDLIPDQKDSLGSGQNGIASQLEATDSHVFSRVERKYLEITDMLDRYLEDRIKTIAIQEHRQWEQVKTLQDWEKFRDLRVEKLRKTLGPLPGDKCPLLYQESGSLEGEGYQVKNVSFQSRPGFFVAANLYLPAEPKDDMPGIVIIPSHHYPKIQGELKDSGIVWARSGCAVLVLESLGYGERVEATPWYRQPYHSESQLEFQLNLIGQNRLAWIAWDVSRAVDLFFELGNVDPDKLILIGSVTWGGGRPAALAGLLDERFDAVVPFNWGRVYWESYGILRSAVDHLTPWLTCAAIAPRKFVYAHEFSWEGEEGHALPSISVPAWPRYEKVYGLYDARGNLSSAQGKGLLRVKQTMGDCYSLGSVQRRPLYRIFNEWFDIPMPSDEDLNIELDSWLTFDGARKGLDVVKLKESLRRMPDTLLLSITPQVDARLDRRALHELARDFAGRQLRAARNNLAQSNSNDLKLKLAGRMERVLGDTGPPSVADAQTLWKKSLDGAVVEALELEPEPGIMVPLLIIKPAQAAKSPLPLVVGLAEGGKDRFLKQRSGEIENLLSHGIAVCLPDVRGTGETAPSQYNRNPYLSDRVMDLGETLLGQRLRDVRAVLAFLRQREDLDSRKVALWGESFAPVNEDNLWIDELSSWPIAPRIQHFSSPLGAHLALFTALQEDGIMAVAARGAIVSYLSLLESNITYTPFDMVIPNVFEAGDISDICASLAPIPLLLEGVVDGRNRAVGPARLKEKMRDVLNTYGEAGKTENLLIRTRTGSAELVNWLVAQLR
ncbi:MAG: hypothetical protein FVQ81_03795 [Candidatus Glassbacteria bacterium]|nr:hypothetical protein [Candidatus Glassbacteria bacterium]